MKYYIAPRLCKFLGVRGITLWPFGIYLIMSYDMPTLRRHEAIHWKQQKYMLGIFFYIWYFLEWGIKLIKFGKMAYYHISFEKEAYKNAWRDSYLLVMKPYGWIRYVFN